MATFYNQATLRYGNTAVASNVVAGEILETLTVTKTAVDEDYRPGDTLTYVVSLTNTGETALAGLTLTDDLGAYTVADGLAVTPLEYVPGSVQVYYDGVPQPAPAVSAADPLTLTGLTVQDNGSTMILYQATVNEFAPLGTAGAVTNTVSVSGGGLMEPVTASAVVDADVQPILSISKALSPVAVTENGRVTYTFVLENRGSTEASGDMVFTDIFDPVLTGLAATYQGQPWTPGTHYTYEEATGVFTSAPGQIAIPAATVSQDPQTGVWSVIPGAVTLVITGAL